MKYTFAYLILSMFTFGVTSGMELIGKKKLDIGDKIGCAIIAPLCFGTIYGAYLTKDVTGR